MGKRHFALSILQLAIGLFWAELSMSQSQLKWHSLESAATESHDTLFLAKPQDASLTSLSPALDETLKRWANAPNANARQTIQQEITANTSLAHVPSWNPIFDRPTLRLNTTLVPKIQGPKTNQSQPLVQNVDKVTQPTLVHFWANWCAPCRYELPQLGRFYSDQQAFLTTQGLGVLVVNADPTYNTPTNNNVVQALQGIPAAHDPEFVSYRKLTGMDAVALPATVLVLPDGRTKVLAFGTLAWDDPSLAAKLSDYLTSVAISPESTPDIHSASQPMLLPTANRGH